MDNDKSPEMTAEMVAHEILAWAKKSRMISGFSSTKDINDKLISDLFAPAGLKESTLVLQDRGISYVGVNEHENSVQIFLKRPPRAKDRDLFSKLGRFGVPIHVTGGSLGHASNHFPPSVNVPPATFRDHRYTCGSSIYLSTETGAGTIGALVKDKTGNMFGLSNNHVSGGCNYAELTLPVQAPGQIDIAAGQPDPFTIGHHYGVMPFVDGLPNIVATEHNLDAAIFKIADPDRVSSFQRASFDTPSETSPLRANMQVMKVGRTTGLTQGKVISHFVDPYPVIYDVGAVSGGKKIVYFTDLFAIENQNTHFAQNGDSGAIIVTTDSNKEKRAVGIVVATDGNQLTLALSLDVILNYFEVELVSGHNV